jgi:hypothetical protein
MGPAQTLIAFVLPYLFAWLTAAVVQRISVVSPKVTADIAAQNALGRLTAKQRWALLVYGLPELMFSIVAVFIAVFWNPGTGLDGTVLRWGLAGMALVRLGISWPMWQDIAAGRVDALTGPLRKIQFRKRRALATENGPVVVLPVEQAVFAAHEAGVPATIYYAPNSKRVVAVLAGNVPEAAH